MIITAQQAAALMAIDGLDRYPYRLVNSYGADAIVEWLDGLGWPTHKDCVSAWIADAEAQPSDETAIFEIPARATHSGRPETLELTEECFDWHWDSAGSDLILSGSQVVQYSAAVALMDDDIRETLHHALAPCTDQAFFNAYCVAHADKFGAPFIVN